jgi:hypothetical protein
MMELARYVLGLAVGTFLSSLTDWLFMGVLFHDKYLTYPEVWWRSTGGSGEVRANVIASLVNILTVGGLMGLCYRFDALTYDSALVLALGVWTPIRTRSTNCSLELRLLADSRIGAKAANAIRWQTRQSNSSQDAR